MTTMKNSTGRRRECKRVKVRQTFEGKTWARRDCKAKTKSLETAETSKYLIDRIVISQRFLRCQIVQDRV